MGRGGGIFFTYQILPNKKERKNGFVVKKESYSFISFLHPISVLVG
jgi:hypothetical protein